MLTMTEINNKQYSVRVQMQQGPNKSYLNL